jgi:hypothetical protein
MTKTLYMIIAASLATLFPASQSLAAGPDVTIANTPLPLTGTVSISPADIANGIDQGEATRQLLQYATFVQLGGGSAACDGTNPIKVPAGKRLVITNVSGQSSTPPPALLSYISLATTTDVSHAFVIVPALSNLSFQSQTPVNGGAAGQQMHLYSDVDLLACGFTTAANTGSRRGPCLWLLCGQALTLIT